MKKIIKLDEAALKKIINESVKMILNEGSFDTLPHLISKYDASHEDEYSSMDKLIVKLNPYYERLSNDTFFPNEKPVGNLGSLSAARKMREILNTFFGGDYIEIVRGGASVILSMNTWYSHDYDMQEEYCNYSLKAKNDTPLEIQDELDEISESLAHGFLPGVASKIKARDAEKELADRESNGGLKILGKINLSPEDLNKKRW